MESHYRPSKRSMLVIGENDCSGRRVPKEEQNGISTHSCYAPKLAQGVRNTQGILGVFDVSDDFVMDQIWKYPHKLIDSTNSQYLRDSDIVKVLKHLLPITYLLTPNIPEAQQLLRACGKIPPKINSVEDLVILAKILYSLGPQMVFLKGGHFIAPHSQKDARIICDVLVHHRPKLQKDLGPGVAVFTAVHTSHSNIHGTGCAMASALANYLAKGLDVTDAIENAGYFVEDNILKDKRPIPGRGHIPTGSRSILTRPWQLGRGKSINCPPAAQLLDGGERQDSIDHLPVGPQRAGQIDCIPADQFHKGGETQDSIDHLASTAYRARVQNGQSNHDLCRATFRGKGGRRDSLYYVPTTPFQDEPTRRELSYVFSPGYQAKRKHMGLPYYLPTYQPYRESLMSVDEEEIEYHLRNSIAPITGSQPPTAGDQNKVESVQSEESVETGEPMRDFSLPLTTYQPPTTTKHPEKAENVESESDKGPKEPVKDSFLPRKSYVPPTPRLKAKQIGAESESSKGSREHVKDHLLPQTTYVPPAPRPRRQRKAAIAESESGNGPKEPVEDNVLRRKTYVPPTPTIQVNPPIVESQSDEGPKKLARNDLPRTTYVPPVPRRRREPPSVVESECSEGPGEPIRICFRPDSTYVPPVPSHQEKAEISETESNEGLKELVRDDCLPAQAYQPPVPKCQEKAQSGKLASKEVPKRTIRDYFLPAKAYQPPVSIDQVEAECRAKQRKTISAYFPRLKAYQRPVPNCQEKAESGNTESKPEVFDLLAKLPATTCQPKANSRVPTAKEKAEAIAAQFWLPVIVYEPEAESAKSESKEEAAGIPANDYLTVNAHQPGVESGNLGSKEEVFELPAEYPAEYPAEFLANYYLPATNYQPKAESGESKDEKKGGDAPVDVLLATQHHKRPESGWSVDMEEGGSVAIDCPPWLPRNEQSESEESPVESVGKPTPTDLTFFGRYSYGIQLGSLVSEKVGQNATVSGEEYLW